MNKGITIVRRFNSNDKKSFLLLLRQGLTSIPFLFVSVTDRARRNLVHMKRRHEIEGICCTNATTFFFCISSKLYARIIQIMFGHLLADVFIPSTFNVVHCKESESPGLYTNTTFIVVATWALLAACWTVPLLSFTAGGKASEVESGWDRQSSFKR